MSKKLIVKYFGISLQDFVNKTRIQSKIKFLKESQFWSDERIYNYRLYKLKCLVEYSYNNVPYYTELFDKHSISPSIIKTLEDIKKIPILTKELARANQEKLVSRNTNFKYIKNHYIFGIPILISFTVLFSWYSDTLGIYYIRNFTALSVVFGIYLLFYSTAMYRILRQESAIISAIFLRCMFSLGRTVIGLRVMFLSWVRLTPTRAGIIRSSGTMYCIIRLIFRPVKA